MCHISILQLCYALPLGQNISLTDSEKYWTIIGLAINKAVVPQLQPFVDGVLQEVYQHLCPQLQSQSTQSSSPMKDMGGIPLQYKNINSNHSTTKQNYNYDVVSHVDFAKLFLQPHMIQFNNIMECDPSALLGLILKVDDSKCQIKFKDTVVIHAAENLKSIRNAWAHCKFTEWNPKTFDDGFKYMEEMVKAIKGDEKQVHIWKKYGWFLAVVSKYLSLSLAVI